MVERWRDIYIHHVEVARIALESGEITITREFNYSGLQKKIITDPETGFPIMGVIMSQSTEFEDLVVYSFRDGLLSIEETFSINDGIPKAKRQSPYLKSKLGESYDLIFTREEYTPSELRDAIQQLEELIKPSQLAQ